jgi:hypothetical protein
MLPSKFEPALIGTGFWLLVTLIVGELLKLVLVERLFSLTRDKLIPAFAWAYKKFREIKTWLKNTEAWQAVRAFGKSARQYLTEIKKSAALQHLQVASRRVVVRHINSSLDLDLRCLAQTRSL